MTEVTRPRAERTPNGRVKVQHGGQKPRQRRIWVRRCRAYAAFHSAAGVLAFLSVSPAVGASPAGGAATSRARIDLPNGFFPEGIERGPGTSFFVGSLLNGTICGAIFEPGRGRCSRPARRGARPPGSRTRRGHDRIWVAGGGPQLIGSGDVRVYDASSGALLATYQPPGVGLLNDVAITRDAVYVTDSGFPQLVVIPWRRDGTLPPPSAATILPLGGDMLQAPGINLNGIVAKNGFLLVANSTTGKLFRVDPATGIADKLDLGGADLSYPDGLELFGRTSSTSSGPSTTGSP